MAFMRLEDLDRAEPLAGGELGADCRCRAIDLAGCLEIPKLVTAPRVALGAAERKRALFEVWRLVGSGPAALRRQCLGCEWLAFDFRPSDPRHPNQQGC
jgi:hypothetical protein